MENIWTEDAQREAGLFVPVIEMVGVCTAEKLDGRQGVGSAVIRVEISSISAELFSSCVAAAKCVHRRFEEPPSNQTRIQRVIQSFLLQQQQQC